MGHGKHNTALFLYYQSLSLKKKHAQLGISWEDYISKSVYALLRDLEGVYETASGVYTNRLIEGKIA